MVCLLVASTSPAFSKPQIITRSQILMGTSFEITIEAEPTDAEQGFLAFFQEVRRLDKVLSHYDPQSELSSLMQSSGQGAVKVSKDLYEVLREAEGISRMSQGAFDITVGVWTPPHGVFDESGPRDPRVGWRLVELLSNNEVRLKAQNMRLDLGGLAKGYALDKGKKILLDLGLQRFLLSSGASTFVAGLPPRGETAWPILIPSLDKGGSGLLKGIGKKVSLAENALSVSECLPKPEGCGIFDPVHGVLMRGPQLSAVIASKAVLADGMSTALLVQFQFLVRSQNIDGTLLLGAENLTAWIADSNRELFLGSKPEKAFRKAKF